MAVKMTVCFKISDQKDRHMLRMHRTRDQVLSNLSIIYFD